MTSNSNITPTPESEVTTSAPQETNSASTSIPQSASNAASDSFDVLDDSQSVSSSTPLDESNLLDNSTSQSIESALSNSSSTTSEPTAPTEVTVIRPYENWTSVPLDDYTVTEGLLLCVVAALLILAIMKLFKL